MIDTSQVKWDDETLDPSKVKWDDAPHLMGPMAADAAAIKPFAAADPNADSIGKAFQGAQDVGSTLATRLTPAAMLPMLAGGAAGIGSLASEKPVGNGLADAFLPAPVKMGMALANPDAVSRAADAVTRTEEPLNYQPQTGAGKVAAAVPDYVFNKIGQGADYLGQKTADVTGSPLAGAGVSTAAQLLPLLLGERAVRGGIGTAKAVRAADLSRGDQSIPASIDTDMAGITDRASLSDMLTKGATDTPAPTPADGLKTMLDQVKTTIAQGLAPKPNEPESTPVQPPPPAVAAGLKVVTGGDPQKMAAVIQGAVGDKLKPGETPENLAAAVQSVKEPPNAANRPVATEPGSGGAGTGVDTPQVSPEAAARAAVLAEKPDAAPPLHPWTPVDTTKPIPLAGGVVEPEVPGGQQKVAIDPRIPQFVKVDGKDIDAHEAIGLHERTEKTLMEQGLDYADAHDLATKAENAFVAKKYGIDPQTYQDALKPHIANALKEASNDPNIPPTLDTKPYTDEGDGGLLKPAPVDAEAPSNNKTATPTVEVPLANLSLSKDVPQFKGGANESTGVVEPLGGTFDRRGTGPIQVWRRNDGTMEVISGRHRLDLARRSGEETIPAQVYNESDGFTKEHAASLDAELNIRDGQGKVADYVQYLQQPAFQGEAGRAEADSRGLLARSTGRRAHTIASQGDAALIAAHRAGEIKDDAAVQIAQAAPNDARLQALGMKLVAEGKSNAVAANTMRAVKLMAGDKPAEQGDIFGFDDSAMREAENMARVASAKQRELSEQVAAVQGAAKRPDKAKALGVDVRDPEGVNKRIAELKAERAEWDNWSSNPRLVSDIRGELGLADLPVRESPPAEDAPFVDTATASMFSKRQGGADADMFGGSTPERAKTPPERVAGTRTGTGEGGLFDGNRPEQTRVPDHPQTDAEWLDRAKADGVRSESDLSGYLQQRRHPETESAFEHIGGTLQDEVARNVARRIWNDAPRNAIPSDIALGRGELPDQVKFSKHTDDLEAPDTASSELAVKPISDSEKPISVFDPARMEELRQVRDAGKATPEQLHELSKLQDMAAHTADVNGELIPGVLNARGREQIEASGQMKPVRVKTDLDDFKDINDTLGHDVGDQALKLKAEAMRDAFGPGNVWREGGDEFGAHADTEEAAHAAMQQVRDKLAGARLERVDDDGNVLGSKPMKVSYGVGRGKTPKEAAKAADNALYADKNARTAAGERTGRRSTDAGTDAARVGAGNESAPSKGQVPAGGQGQEVAVAEPPTKTAPSKPPPTKPVETAAETTPAKPEGTSPRNAAVDQARIDRDLEALPQAERQRWQIPYSEAFAKIAADHEYPRKLAAEVADKPRPLSTTEVAALNIDLRKLREDRAEATRQVLDAREAGDTIGEAQAIIRQKTADGLLDVNEHALKHGGTETARSQSIRNSILKDDYSLSRNMDKAKEAGGNKITDKDEADIKEWSDKLKEHEERISRLEAGKAAREKADKMTADEKEQARVAKRMAVLREKIAARTKVCPI